MVELIDKWDCANPPVNDHYSIAFWYEIGVYYLPGCKGEVCFSIIGHPELGEICINDPLGRITLKGDIIDICGDPVKFRSTLGSFVDMEEPVIFTAEIYSQDPELELPTVLNGEVAACGIITPITLYFVLYDPGHAVYQSSSYVPRTFFQGCFGNLMIFRLNRGQLVMQSAWAQEAKFIVSNELNFIDNLELDGYGSNVVCYPWASFLAFGTSVTIDPNGWPPCVLEENLVCGISGYLDDEVIIYTDGPIVLGGFDTEPTQSSYEIDSYYHWEQKSLNWTANVNYGPKREAEPFSTSIQIHHGCEAHDIAYDPQYPVPSGDTVSCGDVVYLMADPNPEILQGEVEYCWELVAGSLGDVSFPEGAEVILKTNKIKAELPGDVQIRYRIKDSDTGEYTSGYSPSFTLHLVPKIEITTPNTQDDTATFNTDNPGVLIVGAGANVTPASCAGDLVWNITTIVGSTLQPLPSPSPDTVNFRFTTLPATHTEFAKKKWIYASLPAWNVIDSVQVYFFFSKYALNHTGTIYHQHEPNWYFYWKQTNAGIAVPQDYGDPRCTSNSAGFYIPDEYEIHFCDAAAESAPSSCGSAVPDSGIDLFAKTGLHEGQHYLDWWNFWPNGHIQSADMDPRDPNAGPKWPPVGDYVPDNLEGTSQYPDFDPTKQDSDQDGYYDFDDLGYDAECSWTNGNADTADWANPGKQYK